MKVTQATPTRSRTASRPAVLYSRTQHAREWLAGETCRRTLRLFLDNYGEGTALGTDRQPVLGLQAKEITKLVDTRELWFMCIVANPDGYDYTFTPGQPPVAQEPARQRRRRRDQQRRRRRPEPQLRRRTGATTTRARANDPSSETYRGPGPASEPETKALDGAHESASTSHWNKNDHTCGRAAAVAVGLAGSTPTRRTSRSSRRSPARDDNSAIPDDANPTRRVGALHHQRRHERPRYDAYRTISFTPEGTARASTAAASCSRTSRPTCRPSSSATCSSRSTWRARRTTRATRSRGTGSEAQDFEVDSFDVSYGSPQTVQVNARRDLGNVGSTTASTAAASTRPDVRVARRRALRQGPAATGTTACAARSTAPTPATT